MLIMAPQVIGALPPYLDKFYTRVFCKPDSNSNKWLPEDMFALNTLSYCPLRLKTVQKRRGMTYFKFTFQRRKLSFRNMM
jgi:hypothetical protein